MTQDLTRTFLSSGVIELRVLAHIVVMDSDLKTKMYKWSEWKKYFFPLCFVIGCCFVSLRVFVFSSQ